MKTHSLIGLVAAAVCVFAAGCASVPKNQVCVSSSAVFNREDMRMWRLTMVTQKPENFRLTGRHFELWGETVPSGNGGKRCLASVWLVGCQIVYEDHNYIKMIAQGSGSEVTSTREVPKDAKLTSGVDVSLPDAAVIHQLNSPLVIGTTGDQPLSLIVGTAVYDRRAEPTTSASGNQPIRSEINRASSAAGSDR